MSKELKHIFSQDSFTLTDEVIKAYVAGTLSAEDKHFVERQMANDEFLNDAIEGLLLAKQKGSDFLVIDEIKDNISNTKKNIIQINTKRFYYAAAATITLLLGIGSLYFYFADNQSSTNEIALRHKVDNTDESPNYEITEIEEKSNTSESVSVLSEDNYTDKKTQSKSKYTKSNELSTDDASENNEDDIIINTLAANKALSKEPLYKNEKDFTFENSDLDDNSSSASPAIQSPSIQVNSESSDQPLIASSEKKLNTTESISAGAVAESDQVLAKVKRDESSIVDEAHTLFEKEQFQNALSIYLGINPRNYYYAEAQWRISLCYEKMKDYDKLKLQLKKIIQEKGSYSKAADKKLKALSSDTLK